MRKLKTFDIFVDVFNMVYILFCFLIINNLALFEYWNKMKRTFKFIKCFVNKHSTRKVETRTRNHGLFCECDHFVFFFNFFFLMLLLLRNVNDSNNFSAFLFTSLKPVHRILILLLR